MLLRYSPIMLLFISLFAVFANIPFASMPGEGLAQFQNNISWFWVSLILIQSILIIKRQQQLTVPYWWKLGLFGVLLSIVPFILTLNISYYGSGSLLALVVAWFFILALIQIKDFSQFPAWILYSLLAMVLVQSIWGVIEIVTTLLEPNTNAGAKDLAPSGIFHQVNVFATFMVTGLIVTAYLLFNSDKRTHILALLFLSIMVMFLISISNSRTAYLGLLIALVFFVVFAIKKAQLKKLLTWLACLGVATVLGSFLTNIAGIDKSYSKINNRMAIYTTSVELIQESPIIGHGTGTFEKLFVDKYAENVKNYNWSADISNLTHPHNELLKWGVEGGLISILGIVIIGFSILILIFKNALSYSYKFAFLSLLTPIGLHTQTELPFYVASISLIILCCLIAFIFHEIRKLEVTPEHQDSYSLRSSATPYTKLICGLLFLLSSIFFITNLWSIKKWNDFFRSGHGNFLDAQGVIHSTGWEHNLESMYLGKLVNVGISLKDIEQIKIYETWVEKESAIRPRIEYYNNLYIAYVAVEDTSNAERILKKMQQLYPNHPLSRRIKP